MKMSNRPRFEPNDGPRRLKQIVRGRKIHFPTRGAAERYWEQLCLKILQYNTDDARATIVISYQEETEGWAIHGVIHPARLQYRMALEERGVTVEVGEKGPHWHRLSPKTNEELMEDFKRSQGALPGRVWL